MESLSTSFAVLCQLFEGGLIFFTCSQLLESTNLAHTINLVSFDNSLLQFLWVSHLVSIFIVHVQSNFILAFETFVFKD